MSMAAVIALAGTTLGWVTQVQSNFGVTASQIAQSFRGTLPRTGNEDPMKTLGYYWHYPALTDDNRGLGGGIAWAFDDELCVESDRYGSKKKFEDTFKEDFFFAKFVTCVDIRASLHRAFKTWTDVQPQLRFVDVTEECRRIHGGVYSNCSLVELFITHRDNSGVIPGKMAYMGKKGGEAYEVKHPRPWPNSKTGSGAADCSECDNEGIPFPGGSVVNGVAERPATMPDGISDCSVVGTVPQPDNPTSCVDAEKNWYANRKVSDATKKLAGLPEAKRRQLEAAETTAQRHRRQLEAAEEIFVWESMAGVAAASALQYGRYATDLRSTNGMVQRYSSGDGRKVIEAFGGIISFNVENCWYLDTAFCGPLHQLKAKMGTNGAAAMIKGIAFGIFALALLVFFMLIGRVLKHQHCCDAEGKERSFKQKARGSAEEMSNFGVLPTFILATCLWVPIALQQTIVAPCWECYDFEAAAVHEIGHVLGFGHPDAVLPIANANSATGKYPIGENGYNNWTVSNAGMKPYDTKGFPHDLCMYPWDHVVNGTWDGADDMNPDSGVRQAIMYSLTEHNPKTCLTSDDIEGVYTLYPLCDGRALPSSTGLKKGQAGYQREGLECYKTKLYIGAVRVLVYIFIPILFILVIQILILHCLKSHHDDLVDELHESRTKAVQAANKHKKMSIEMQAKAKATEEALTKQKETEEARVEERAEEMAAQMIQAKMRGNMVRKASASNFGADKAAKMAASGRIKGDEKV